MAAASSVTDENSLERILRLPVLSRNFFERPSVEVARALLGKVLVLPPCAGRIVEVEAYLGAGDRAAHASRGLTGRTRVLFGPPGFVYVYFIYGMYECLNLVAEPEGSPGCVLIRALEPLAGVDVMQRRRPAASRPEQLCSGPGRLTRALGITRKLYGTDSTRGPLTVREGGLLPARDVAAGPRVGIRHGTEWELRYWVRNSPSVSRIAPDARV
jgi:DNA-3-methyladenine glycosylase